ncbi:MAG TPA: holo-ACP synthase [Mycobacteriales bacterium]|nr:holo-ACP synthase [Mycobacteriales bacterium]
MIVGIGVDVVDLARFAASLERTPSLAERLFTPAERTAPPASQAATFAAKEALAKALGAPDGLAWHDVEVRRDDTGRPELITSGTVAAAAASRGIERWHLSISHDAGTAVAMVVAEAGS